ncbi:hypothetical protein PR048_014646, partial [Dryococelus australis]
MDVTVSRFWRQWEEEGTHPTRSIRETEMRVLASHQGEPGSILGGITTEIVPEYSASRRYFSGISRLPRPCIPVLLHSHLISPSSSQDLVVKSRPNLSTLEPGGRLYLQQGEGEAEDEGGGDADGDDGRAEQCVLPPPCVPQGTVLLRRHLLLQGDCLPALVPRQRLAALACGTTTLSSQYSPVLLLMAFHRLLTMRPLHTSFNQSGSRGGRAVRLLASQKCETGSILIRVTFGFSQMGIVLNDAADRRDFSGISISPTLQFRRFYILTSFHSHRLSKPRCMQPPNGLSMEQHRNKGAGEMGDPRGNPPTSGIVRHDSHMRKSRGRHRRESNPVLLGGRQPSWNAFAAPQRHRVDIVRTCAPGLSVRRGPQVSRKDTKVTAVGGAGRTKPTGEPVAAAAVTGYGGALAAGQAAAGGGGVEAQRGAAGDAGARPGAAAAAAAGVARPAQLRAGVVVLRAEAPHAHTGLQGRGRAARSAASRTLTYKYHTRRLARSPSTKANWVQSPAGSLNWESCRTMPLVGGFSRGSPTVAGAAMVVALVTAGVGAEEALRTVRAALVAGQQPPAGAGDALVAPPPA